MVADMVNKEQRPVAFTFTSFQRVSLLLEQLITAQQRKDTQLSVETEFCFADYDTYFMVMECLYFQHTAGSTGSAGQISWQKHLKSEILYAGLQERCHRSNGSLSTSTYNPDLSICTSNK